MSTMFSTVDKKLILVVFFLSSVTYSDCVSLTLSGSSSHSVKDKHFTLTCTVSGAENLQDRIVFFKDGGNVTLASLRQKPDQCSVWNPPADRQSYSVECGDGTNSRLSTTKKYSLTINKASDQDVTDWICKLNTALVSSNTLRLEMSSGPDSVELTSLGNVEEGDDLNVNCVADCKPPCLFSWSLNNQQTESGSELSVTNVRRNQTGQKYTCTVTNRVSAKSLTKSFTLKVHYGPENIKQNRSSPVQVVEGKNVAVLCEADCDEVCSYKWKCQTKEINDAVLSFTQIHRTEAGVCVCIVTNVNTNKSKNKTVSLDVQYQTSITALTLNSKSTKITVDELTPVSLRCEVDSNPASHIKLLNNSHILREVKNSKSVEYSWNEAGCLDTGFYTCEAGNNIKSDFSQSVQLLVTCSPRLDHRVTVQKKCTAVEGGNVTLHISVIANPVPTFTWYKLTDVNNKSLGSAQPVLTTNVSAVGEYKLTNVTPEDFGIYQVVVSNGETRNDLVVKLSVNKIEDPGSSKIVAAAGGIAGGLVVVVVVVVLLVFFFRQRKQKNTRSDKCLAAPPAALGELYAVADRSKNTAAVKKKQETFKGKKAKTDCVGNDNMAFFKDDKLKRSHKGKPEPATAKRRNERQLVYTEIEFTNEKMSQPMNKREEPTVYIQIDFSKKAPTLSDNDVHTEKAEENHNN